MLYILKGQDDFSLTQSLEEIKRGIGDQAALSAGTTTLDGQQVTLERLRTVGETVPFLMERRLVIAKGLLERFEPRGRSARQKGARADHREEYKPWRDCIEKLPDSTILVLLEGKITGNNPLFQALSRKAVVRSFPPFGHDQLRQWVQQRVAEAGGTISSPALDLLAKLVGSNLWAMAGEIDKLILFTSGRRIEEKDVRALVSDAQQADVFAMVDAIIDSKVELAEQRLQQLLRRGASPAYLLAMLVRQLGLIVRAKGLRNQKLPKSEIQNKLGLTNEFALRRTLEQASRYSLSRLKQVYQELLETDLSIKTGRYDSELALDILVAELGRQGKR